MLNNNMETAPDMLTIIDYFLWSTSTVAYYKHINTETLQISTGNSFCYKELLNMEYDTTTTHV